MQLIFLDSSLIIDIFKSVIMEPKDAFLHILSVIGVTSDNDLIRVFLIKSGCDTVDDFLVLSKEDLYQEYEVMVKKEVKLLQLTSVQAHRLEGIQKWYFYQHLRNVNTWSTFDNRSPYQMDSEWK